VSGNNIILVTVIIINILIIIIIVIKVVGIGIFGIIIVIIIVTTVVVTVLLVPSCAFVPVASGFILFFVFVVFVVDAVVAIVAVVIVVVTVDIHGVAVVVADGGLVVFYCCFAVACCWRCRLVAVILSWKLQRLQAGKRNSLLTWQ